MRDGSWTCTKSRQGRRVHGAHLDGGRGRARRVSCCYLRLPCASPTQPHLLVTRILLFPHHKYLQRIFTQTTQLKHHPLEAYSSNITVMVSFPTPSVPCIQLTSKVVPVLDKYDITKLSHWVSFLITNRRWCRRSHGGQGLRSHRLRPPPRYASAHSVKQLPQDLPIWRRISRPDRSRHRCFDRFRLVPLQSQHVPLARGA